MHPFIPSIYLLVGLYWGVRCAYRPLANALFTFVTLWNVNTVPNWKKKGLSSKNVGNTSNVMQLQLAHRPWWTGCTFNPLSILKDTWGFDDKLSFCLLINTHHEERGIFGSWVIKVQGKGPTFSDGLYSESGGGLRHQDKRQEAHVCVCVSV